MSKIQKIKTKPKTITVESVLVLDIAFCNLFDFWKLLFEI